MKGSTFYQCYIKFIIQNVSTLGNEAEKVFGSSYDITVDDIVDKIRQEWKMYQVENIHLLIFRKMSIFLPVFLPNKNLRMRTERRL